MKATDLRRVKVSNKLREHIKDGLAKARVHGADRDGEIALWVATLILNDESIQVQLCKEKATS